MAELNDQDVRDMRDGFKLLARVDQKLSDHLEWSKTMSEKRDKQLDDLDKRLKPVEEAVGGVRTLVKAMAWIGGGAGAVGGVSSWAFWDHIRSAIKHYLSNAQ